MRFSEPSNPVTNGRSNGAGADAGRGRGESFLHHMRRPTHPFRKSFRSKPRRWPLVLRFIKGAIHMTILIPVVCHALFTVLIVCLDKYVYESLGLPSTIIPSLSIVVGLILVFRNQTSYNRFWEGRNSLAAINTAIRNLSRSILTHAYNPAGPPLTAAEKHDVERTIRVLMAIPYAVKNYLRAEWGAAWALSPDAAFILSDGKPGMVGAYGGGGSATLSHAAESSSVMRRRSSPGAHDGDGNDEDDQGAVVEERIFNAEYDTLLPPGLQMHEDEGLGLPLQLTFFIDGFIKRGIARDWFTAPGAGNLQAQLNVLTESYGRMETIKLTPIPIAHLIHQKQVLALFGCVLPFAMVDEMGWWAVPIVSLVIFTLYGIEGIGSQLEDPFGYDRNDIKMDAIVEDERVEIEAVLREWRRVVGGEREVGNGEGEDGTVAVVGYEPPEMFIRKRSRAAAVAAGGVDGGERIRNGA
ncbi:hypothetical protein FQN53_003944 [Emmonsiellopsis sp. PD_33]|nr:hypothetical protein FQN53_003944 [Emmonsiellopsis sp. PD_33]